MSSGIALITLTADERMAKRDMADFVAGVIEGFYGQPWTQAERFELFDWMADWGLNSYLYAPKDDMKHRATWRERYSATEAETLGALIKGCQQRNLRFIYALSPGLDIRYGNETDLDHLMQRFEQMLTLGCEHFALLFDDIPDRMDSEDLKRWTSFASAQCHVANAMFQWTRERSPQARFFFCPTPYCGRMAERKLGGENYLSTVGCELLPEIDVFWTGPEIISREIPVAHVQDLETLLRRKPLIWDNLHANDYDGRRFYCGPYTGRPPELRSAVNGLMVNPNNEFPLNFVPLRTFSKFVQAPKCLLSRPSGTLSSARSGGEGRGEEVPEYGAWNAREAYLSAMREWLPRFETIGQPVTLEDLILLGDCFYLPYEEGPEAEALYQHAHNLLAGSPSDWGKEVAAFRQQATRLRELCARMTELRQRPLFYASSRRIWELREELDLLERYVAFKADGKDPDVPCRSDFHLPGTYRGGMVPRLQRLLVQQADGTFTPTEENGQVLRSTSPAL